MTWIDVCVFRIFPLYSPAAPGCGHGLCLEQLLAYLIPYLEAVLYGRAADSLGLPESTLFDPRSDLFGPPDQPIWSFVRASCRQEDPWFRNLDHSGSRTSTGLLRCISKRISRATD